jgi:hypothetical protein
VNQAAASRELFERRLPSYVRKVSVRLWVSSMGVDGRRRAGCFDWHPLGRDPVSVARIRTMSWRQGAKALILSLRIRL